MQRPIKNSYPEFKHLAVSLDEPSLALMLPKQDTNGSRARWAAHQYARRQGWKIQTTFQNGHLYIWRLQ